jgi:Fe-S-cluster containining protein
LNRGVNPCDKCGACCCTFPVFVSINDIRREPRLKAAVVAVAPWESRQGADFQLHPLPFLNGCQFLDQDSKLCRIYETRPDVCRRFEAGSPECQEARARIGLGPLIDKDPA